MSFNLELGDFHRLAQAALQDSATDFRKSRVADRLQKLFPGRDLKRLDASASLALRRDLAKAINDAYRRDKEVAIPPSVVAALNVNKVASGFKLASDGSLVATNHPLTDRRLVSIMTAIKLASPEQAERCQALDGRISELLNLGEKGSFALRTFVQFGNESLKSLTSLIRSAADGAVKPAALRAYLPTITKSIKGLHEQFNNVEALLDKGERSPLAEIINNAVELAEQFGAEVAKFRIKAPVEIPVVVELPPIEQADALVTHEESVFSREQSQEARKQKTLLDLSAQLGKIPSTYKIELSELVRFSDDELEAFGRPETDATDVISKKVNAISTAVNDILSADLGDADRETFVRQAISENGAYNKTELNAAVKAHRIAQYEAIAQKHRDAFEKNVADKVRDSVLSDAKCALGIENLNKDFPTMKSFAKLVKRNHPGGELKLLDLNKDGVLLGLLAGKLEDAKRVFDNIDIEKSEVELERMFGAAVEQSANDAIARLKPVLEEAMFEDDRTILTEMALDPSKADAFAEKFAAAKARYSQNVVAMVVQAQLPGKLAASQLKPGSADFTEKRINPEFRDRFGFGPEPVAAVKPEAKFGKDFGVVFADRMKTDEVKQTQDDFAIGLGGGRGETGAKMRSGVRNLFADLFTSAAKAPGGMKKLLIANAAVIQSMMLDPALIESVAVPGDTKSGDAVRVLLSRFLAAIGENVNHGQLTPADFKEALAGVLDGDAFRAFSDGVGEAGAQVLAAMQKRLTAELTDVLRRLSSSGAGQNLDEKTLAELGASGLGSMDEGYGRFLASVLDNYFTDAQLAADHDRMLESFFRNGRSGGSVGDALGALIKGAGPIFQKVLQSIPVDGLPDEIVKALFDVKSGLAPIPDDEIERRLAEAITKNNRERKGSYIDGVEVVKSLGAASVGQALLCRFHLDDGSVTEKVVKLRRSGIKEIAERERAFFNKKANDVSESMKNTFGARIAGIMEELDFTKEAKWIERGQCYGQPDNYEGAACIFGDDPDSYQVNSMKASTLLSPDKDILVLDVAPGKPVDRNLRAAREMLDGIVSKIAKQKTDGSGKKITVYQVKSCFNLIETRRQLVGLYQGLAVQRELVEELVRRFSSELFYVNYDEKGSGGGFMHGDLHGGNMLITKNALSVIDFGNSHSYSKDDRQQLIRFVAACGFSNAGAVLSSVAKLLKTDLSKRSDYTKLVDDIGVILAKGDGNDIASRGMAVVQYLQRQGVQVPDPIINFTETVMRLDAVHRETESVMDDIVSVIEELRVDPNVNRALDPYIDNVDDLFKGYSAGLFGYDSTGENRFEDSLKTIKGIVWKMSEPGGTLSRVDYEKHVLPALNMLRDCPIALDDSGAASASEAARRIARMLNSLGDRLFEPKEKRDVGLSPDHCPQRMISDLVLMLGLLQLRTSGVRESLSSWEPLAGSSVNMCMSAGLTQHNSLKLAAIVGGAAISMGRDAKTVAAEAALTLRRAEVAGVAQKLYQRSSGMIDTRTRRILDRIIDDHFLWSPGDPKVIFKAKKWYETPKNVASLSRALSLNRAKLRAGLESAGVAYDERLENYAMIAFCVKHGVADALAEMPKASFTAMITTLDNEAVKETLRFLREDKSVVDALCVGRCLSDANKNVLMKGLKMAYHHAQHNLRPIDEAVDWMKPDSLGPLVMGINTRYRALKDSMKSEGYDDGDSKIAAQYGMMRFLLEQGVLGSLARLDKKSRGVVIGKFGTKGSGSKDLKELMTKLLDYMNV